MSSIRAGGRDGRRPDAATLEPNQDDIYDWADTAEERDQALAIDRLAGDRELVDALHASGFQGAEWERAAGELVRYGMTVLTSWMLRGTIYQKCADRGRPVERAPFNSIDEAEASSMAGEVVTVALAHFRDDVLVTERWNPARGASLTTYFIGQCILRFPNIYRPWLTAMRSFKAGEDLAVLDRSDDDNAVEDDVVRARVSVDALRVVRNEDARRAMVLVAYGYTYPQIADRLGRTEKAVERMISYGREQINKARKSA